MRIYEVKQASLNFKWTFDRIIPALPGPGSPAFADLCKELSPYGLQAAKISLETPTSRFGDVVLGIALLDDLVGVWIRSSEFELFCRDLYDEDIEVLIKITESIFTAVKSIDADAVRGKATIKMSAHLQIEQFTSKEFLYEHLPQAESLTALIPEAAVYDIKPLAGSNAFAIRVFLANSALYNDSLFVEVSINYQNISEIQFLAKGAEKDYRAVLEMLGLVEKAE